MVLLNTLLTPLALASVAAADIVKNIPPVPLYAAAYKWQYSQLVYQNGGLFASMAGRDPGAFEIVCSPETFDTSDKFGSSSRVLCSNKKDINNPSREKYVLYIKGPISGVASAEFQHVGLARLDEIPAIAVTRFVWGPGPQMFYSGPETKGERAQNFFSLPSGLIFWAKTTDYKLKKGEDWLAISARETPPWLLL